MVPTNSFTTDLASLHPELLLNPLDRRFVRRMDAVEIEQFARRLDEAVRSVASQLRYIVKKSIVSQLTHGRREVSRILQEQRGLCLGIHRADSVTTVAIFLTRKAEWIVVITNGETVLHGGLSPHSSVALITLVNSFAGRGDVLYVSIVTQLAAVLEEDALELQQRSANYLAHAERVRATFLT